MGHGWDVYTLNDEHVGTVHEDLVITKQKITARHEVGETTADAARPTTG